MIDRSRLPAASCVRLLFRAYGGDAERVHERTLAAIADGRTELTQTRQHLPRSAPGIAAGHRRRNPVSRLGRTCRRDGQGRHRHQDLGVARIRLRRARNGHSPTPARQRQTPAVPAARQCSDSSTGWVSTTGALRPSPTDSRLPAQPAATSPVGIPIGISIGKTKNVAVGRRDRGLPRFTAPVGAICGLRRDQRLQPEHARPALAARCRGPGRAHPSAGQ